jgi:hypothetical protein
MDLPLRVLVGNLSHPCAGFTVCHFKDTKHSPDAPAHFHVVISLSDNKSIVLCIITSQMQKLARYYQDAIKNESCLDSMIPLDKSVFGFLDRGCVVDCNQAELLQIIELEKRIDQKYEPAFKIMAHDGQFDAGIKQEIVKGILNSPVVKGIVKKSVSKYLSAYR